MSSHITIAIATYRRPEELDSLLRSLPPAIAQVADHVCRVIVVDNDPDQSASTTCARSALPLDYLWEPKPGISAARNRAIAHAKGTDWIVFLDDDEIVGRHWLAELIRMQSLTGAEMIAGPVKSLLPATTPSYIVGSRLFDRPPKDNGSFQNEAGSGNLLCKYALFSEREPSEWFLDSFGLTGGGDSELTRRFRREGARIAWAAHAEVYETVPLARTSLRWLARRYRRVGAIDYRLGEDSRYKRLRGVLGGAGRIASGATSLAWNLLAHARLDAPAFRRIFRGVGFIETALGGGYREYARQGDV
ncbi:glycosyltransferase family 2 protein [Leucobacter massiliensis]|nr:glycosyltransferase [Leucobacter massiliensis]